MSKPEHIYIRGFWDRVEEEMERQGISKAELARRCRFGRKVLVEKKQYVSSIFRSIMCGTSC